MEVRRGYKQTEVGVIPDDWLVYPLRSLSSFITKGSTPTTYGFKWEQNGILFLRSECVSEAGLDLSQSMYISQDAHKVLSRSEIKSGDILITITGNVGRVIYLDGEFGFGNINQHIARVRIAKSDVNKKYVFHYLSQSSYRTYFNSIVTGQAYPQISLKQVRDAIIPLPSTIGEQTVIATALSDTCALITTLEKLIAKKRNIKQGTMQELLKPKKGWEVKRLGDMASLITKGTTPTSLGKDFTKTGVNFVKIESLEKNGVIIKDKVAFIDEETHLLLKRSQLKENDILISIAGALGRIALVKAELLPANTNQALAIVRLKGESDLDKDYLFYFLNSEVIKKHINAINVQAAQANLSLENINDFLIPHPSIEVQRTISNILSDMDVEIDSLEIKLEKYRQIKSGMMQNLLTGKIRLV